MATWRRLHETGRWRTLSAERWLSVFRFLEKRTRFGQSPYFDRAPERFGDDTV